MYTRMLQNRNFVVLWLTQIVATLGDELYSIGVMVVIFEQTGSSLQTAGVLIARTLPTFLLGPVAGVWVDRYPRKRVIVLTSLARAFLVSLLLAIGRPGAVNVWGIYAIVCGLAAAQTFSKPAQQAIIPSLVAQADLVPANGLIMGSNQATLAASYALGGLLILTLGFRRLVMLDLSCFVMAALLAAALAVPRRTTTACADGECPGTLRAALDGLIYLRDHALARPLITMETLEHWPHGIWTSALMLAFTKRALHGDAEAWGFQNGIFYAGQLVGAMLALALAKRLARQPGWVIIGNAFLFSALTLSYALSPNVPIAIALCFVFGPPSAMRDVAQDALLQASVDDDVLGRIFATRHMLANLSFMLAGVGFAWLADQAPVRWVYIIGAGMYFGTAFYALSSAAIRRSQIVAKTPQQPFATTDTVV